MPRRKLIQGPTRTITVRLEDKTVLALHAAARARKMGLAELLNHLAKTGLRGK